MKSEEILLELRDAAEGLLEALYCKLKVVEEVERLREAVREADMWLEGWIDED